MTAHDDFNGMLSDWLDDQAGRGAPDYVDEILVRTIRTRQRPSWSSLERWLPVQLTFTSRVAPFGRLAWTLLVIALIALAAAVLLLAGVGRRPLPHFGSAANGPIAFVDGGNLRVAAADGANPRTLVSLPDGAEQLTFSPDGTRMAYRTMGSVPTMIVANADGSGAVAVASSPALATREPFGWSPDSRRLVFTIVIVTDKIGTIDVMDADGSHMGQLILGPAAEAMDRFHPAWSPSGEWISFFSTEANGYVGLNVIHPDGTGERRLATSPINPDIVDATWSPDPATNRVVYVTGGSVAMLRPPLDDGDYQDISASPSGKLVMYRESGLKGYFQIHVLDLGTGADRVLPASPAGAAQTGPGFSPDGIHVVYLRVSAGLIFRLVVAPLDGSSVGTELPLRGTLGDDRPTINNYGFTPDGSAVLANELIANVEWLLPIDGSPGTVIARGTAAYDALSTVQRLAP
jgi:Tol biopolymer transport system component